METKKSRKWLQEGDRNTKFFQNAIKSTRVRNTLHILVDDNDKEVFSDREKGDVAVKYFSNLFKSSQPEELHELLNHFSPRVTNSMNMILTRTITEDEIK